MPADVLSSVLHDLRVAGTVCARFRGRGTWAVHYPSGPAASFHLVTEGACQLRLLAPPARAGGPSTCPGGDPGPQAAGGVPYNLAAGDFVVLPHGAAHTLHAAGMAGAAPAVSIADAVRRADARGLVSLGDHGADAAAGAPDGAGLAATSYVCGAFEFAARRPHPAVAALPPVLLVRGGAGGGDGREADGALGPWLPVHLAAATCEAAAGRPGAEVVLARLSDVLFVHAIRAYLADAPAGAGGWVGALRDPAVARALALLHAHPEHDWTVAGVARAVAMSRSRFAARFTALVGQPPLGYLADWRMRRAEAWLADDGVPVGEVAARLGYRSEAAFRHAFRRRVGAPPGAVRRRGARGMAGLPAAPTPALAYFGDVVSPQHAVSG